MLASPLAKGREQSPRGRTDESAATPQKSRRQAARNRRQFNLAGERILTFLSVETVTLSQSPKALVDRLAVLFGGEFECQVSAPVTARQKRPARWFTRYLSTTHEVRCINISRANGAVPASMIRVTIPGNGTHSQEQVVYIRTDQALSTSTWHLISRLTAEFFTKVLHRQRSLIRREMVEARAQSSDLTSFLHRLLHNSASRLNSLIGFEAASVFLVNKSGHALRLRGSTPLKSDKPRSQIAFDVDHRGKVAACFRSGQPRFEFSKDGSLAEGESAETTQSGTSARAYWPIQLQDRTSRAQSRRSQRPILGVFRIVNVTNDGSPLPFSWLTLNALEFASEALYAMSVGFVETDEAAFKKDEAFHASASVVDAVRKNLYRVIRLLFEEPTSLAGPKIRRIYELKGLGSDAIDGGEQVRRLMKTAYASATDIGFQIERANLEFPRDTTEITEKFLADVLFRAMEVVPDMCMAHSVTEMYRVTTPRTLLKQCPFPPPVSGSPEALTSVFVNLLENSVKYRVPGNHLNISVEVSVERSFVNVDIRDNGIGIESSEIKKLTLSHFRSERARAHVVRGSGLGLAWCKEILNLYGGELVFPVKRKGFAVRVRLKRVGGN